MINYCTKTLREQDNTVYYTDIHPHILSTKMDSGNKEEIYKINIREAKPDENTPYVGWLDNEENISLIFRNIILFKVCFPYGYEAEEKRGNGKMIRIFIEEIEKAE